MRSKKSTKQYKSFVQFALEQPWKSKREIRYIKRKKRSNMPRCFTNNYLKMHNKPMLKRDIRDNILKAAVKSGCEIDGDIIMYCGNKYFIHCMMGIVVRDIRHICD